MVFVIAFACGDSVSGMRSFSCCTMSLNRSFLFCNSPFSMMVVRSSMCRCCGVRHTIAQPNVLCVACPKPQLGFLVFKCPRPGKLFSSVSGVVGCVTVLVSARALGCASSSFQFGKSMCRARGFFFFFLTRTNRDVPRS